MECFTYSGGNSVVSVLETADLTSGFLRIWVRQSDSIFFHKIKNRRKTKQKRKQKFKVFFFPPATKCIK